MHNVVRLAVVGIALFLGIPVRAADSPIKFYADLSPETQSATTISSGKGRAEFILERETLKFSWKVTFSGLTSAVSESAIHGPQRLGANAGIQFVLAPKGANSPLVGSTVLSETHLQYLLSDRMYVNIHTVKYPDGELRGQIRRLSSEIAE